MSEPSLVQVMAEVIQGCSDGLSLGEAAMLVDVDRSRLDRWLVLGSRGHEPFKSFRRELRRGVARARQHVKRNLLALSAVEPRAAELYLETTQGAQCETSSRSVGSLGALERLELERGAQSAEELGRLLGEAQEPDVVESEFARAHIPRGRGSRG